MNQKYRDALCDMGHDEAVVFDGPDFDEAIVGVTDESRVIYDYDKMVHCLRAFHNMTEEEAEDFIGYNTMRAIPYAGERAPIIMYPLDIEDDEPPAHPAIDYLEKLLELFTNDKEITVAKAIHQLNQQTKRLCPHCKSKLLPSTVKGYRWQCLICDEDFCDFEVKETK